MAKYKYRIVKKDKWRFELLPNNNNIQRVGYSGDYPTQEKMMAGLKKFKEFLRNNQSNISYIKQTTLKGDTTLYYAYFVFSDENEIFYTSRYEYRYETDNSIKRIIENFDVDIREDLNKIDKER